MDDKSKMIPGDQLKANYEHAKATRDALIAAEREKQEAINKACLEDSWKEFVAKATLESKTALDENRGMFYVEEKRVDKMQKARLMAWAAQAKYTVRRYDEEYLEFTPV